MKTIILIILTTITTFSWAQNKKQIFIAVEGNDQNNGSIGSPLRTLDKAVAKLAEFSLRSEVSIFLRAGNYEIANGLVLSEAETRKIKKLEISGYPREKVRLIGGKRLSTSMLPRLNDQSILSRIPSEARGKVVMIDLTRWGIKGEDILKQYGYGLQLKPVGLEIFGTRNNFRLARWPNDSLLDIGTVIKIPNNQLTESDRYPRFHFDFERPRKWQSNKNVWVAGKFSAGWASDNLEVDSVDLKYKVLTLNGIPKYPVIGAKQPGGKTTTEGRGYFFYNVLEELDSPGEWFVDIANDKIYLWPDNNGSDEIQVSMLQKPFFKLVKTNNVKFSNLTFEVSRGNGIEIELSDWISIIGCNFVNLGLQAAETKNCSHFLFKNCQVEATGAGGVVVDGGDRKKLISADNVIENCEFLNYSRLYRSYTPAISISGVGVKVLHNKIHDSPDQAIIYSGNNHLIAYNRISRVCQDFSDMGAVYTGRDPSSTGTVIKNNYFEEISNSLSDMIAAVYIDDGSGGIDVSNNLFFRCGGKTSSGFGAVHVHGGADNDFKNNIFVECAKAFSNTPWSDKKWREMYLTNPFYIKKLKEEVDIRSSVYQAQYRHLNNFFDTSKVRSRVNYISNTILCKVDKTESGGFSETNTYMTKQVSPFGSVAKRNFSLTNIPLDVKKWEGWQPVEWDKIRK